MNIGQIDVIRNIFPFFGSVSDEDWRSAEWTAVDPSTPHSIREGHLFRHAIFVVSGVVRVYKISPATGREITLYRVKDGECCMLMAASILGDTEYEASMSIETVTEALLLPAAVFKRWMDTIQPFRQYIYKQMIGRMTSVSTLLEQVAFHSIPCRIADYLLTESAKAQEDTLRMTHERLAAELGTAREVVSRALKELAARGAVALRRGEIAIADRRLLHAITI